MPSAGYTLLTVDLHASLALTTTAVLPGGHRWAPCLKARHFCIMLPGGAVKIQRSPAVSESVPATRYHHPVAAKPDGQFAVVPYNQTRGWEICRIREGD
jgi:hypothetical protein